MTIFRIVAFIAALCALLLFLAWAKGYVGHLQDAEDVSRGEIRPGDYRDSTTIRIIGGGEWIEIKNSKGD